MGLNDNRRRRVHPLRAFRADTTLPPTFCSQDRARRGGTPPSGCSPSRKPTASPRRKPTDDDEK